jgi:hypothetical protein
VCDSVKVNAANNRCGEIDLRDPTGSDTVLGYLFIVVLQDDAQWGPSR